MNDDKLQTIAEEIFDELEWYFDGYYLNNGGRKYFIDLIKNIIESEMKND